MAMNDDIHDQEDTSAQSGSVDEGRRRVTKVGLGASALIITLASRSALGCSCKSPSGFASGNLSQAGGKTPTCNGQPPSWWCTQYSYQDCTKPSGSWSTAKRCPGKCATQTDAGTWYKWKNNDRNYPARMFKSDFSCTGNLRKYATAKPPQSYSAQDCSHIQVMLAYPDTIGAHLSAALLNCESGKSDWPSTTQCMQIAHDLDTYGHYEVSAGVIWYESDCLAYLKACNNG
jgi:hypothetical protein